MSSQLTLNQFDALTLAEKLDQFGNKFFTAKQCMILKSMVAFNESSLDSEDVANDLDLSKRSVSSTISSLNRKIQGLIDVDYGWSNEAYYTLDNDVLSSVICIDELIEMGAIDFIEETPAQEIEETPAQEITEETPAQEIEETPAHSLTCQVNLWDLVKDCPTISTRQINKMGYKTAQDTKWNKESLELLKNLVLHDNVEAFCTCTPVQKITEETPAQEITQAIIEKAQAISLENDLVLYKLDCDLDVCVIGFTFNQNEEAVLIYSYEALIDCLSNSPDKTEAIEHFNHNLKNDKYLVSYDTRPFNKVPKRLKSATLKSYSGKQLAKHLDRLQDHFIDKDLTPPYRVDFSYLEIRKYDQECDAYLFQGISKESIEEAVNDTYRLLGI